MKTIGLTRGQRAVVDDEDFEALSRHRWSALRARNTDGSTRTWYAVRTVRVNGRSVAILMHRQIAEPRPCEDVDHVDGDGLNNRRSNLRACSRSENNRNARSHGGSSRFKGVSWHQAERRWRATIRLDGKQLHLGLYDDEEQAARAYDTAAREHFGAFARPNLDGEDVAPSRRKKSSRYRGVMTDGPGRWRAFIRGPGGLVKLGTYDDERAAALAYDAAAVAYRGRDTKRNLPDASEAELLDALLARFNAIAGGQRLKPNRDAAA